MNIYSVVTVARQIGGEYIFIKTEKAFKEKHKAEDLINSLKNFYNKDGKQLPITLDTPHGSVECHCEIGIFEVELEE